MPSCPACDALYAEGVQDCPWCGTPAAFSLETVQGTPSQASRAVEAARAEVGLLRATGVEPAIADHLVDKAEAAAREEKPTHALAYARAAKHAAVIAKTRAHLQADLRRAEEAVRKAKQDGAVVEAAETALREAAASLETGDFGAAEASLRKASGRAEEESRAKFQESLLHAAERAIRHAKERGAVVAEAEQELAAAQEALRTKAFDTAREAASRAKDLAERARKVTRYEKFVASAEHTIDLARNSGADLAPARHLVTEARHALKEGLFADAQAKSTEAKEAVAEAKRFRAGQQLIERGQKAALKEEGKGTDVSGAALILGQALNSLDAREYRKVRDLVRDGREAIKDAVLRRQLATRLATLGGDVTDLKTIGAASADAEALFAQAGAALEAGDFDKARRLTDRCNRAADDAREARREEIIIDTIQRIVAAAATSGSVNPEQVRDLIQDVESMLEGGEAVNVEELVRARISAGDSIRLKELTRRLANIGQSLQELKRADIEVTGSDDTIALANAALDSGKFDEAEGRVAELDEIATSLVQSLRDSAAELIQKAGVAAEKAGSANIPIPEALRMLQSAQDAMAAGKVYEALEFGRLAQIRAESAWKKHFEDAAKRDLDQMRLVEERVKNAREKIESLVSHIEYLTGIGVDVGPAREALGNAQRALEGNRLEEVEAQLQATEKIIEGVRYSLRQSATAELVRIEKLVLDVRAQGLMTPEMEAVFRRAEQAVRDEMHREAIEAIKALDGTIERAREEQDAERQRRELERSRKASERVARVQRMVEELKHANIEVVGAEETLLLAEKAIQGRNFDQVGDVLAELEETTLEMRAELVAATKYLVQKATEAVDAAAHEGLDVVDARALLENAVGFVAKGRLDDAVESASNAKRRAESGMRLKSEEEARAEKVRIETARQKIERLRAVMDDLHRADITVDGSEDAMVKAGAALDARKYEEVHAILADLEALAMSLQEGLKEAAENLLAKSRQNVEAAKEEGLSVRRADMVLGNASEAIRDARYVEAIEYHKVIDDIVEDAKRMRSFRELESEVQVLRSEILRAANLGGDVTATEAILKRAAEEVSLGRYDRVAELTDQVRHNLAETRRHVLEAKLDRAKIAIGKAQLLGAPVPEAEALLPELQAAVDEGNYEAVGVLVRRIEEKVAEASASFVAAKAQEDFLALEDLEKQVANAGITIPEARGLIEDARKLRDERNFDTMAQLMTEARQLLEAGSRKKIVEQHREKIRGLSAMLDTAKRIGANVAEAERVLQQAAVAIQGNDLSMADILVKQAEVSTGLQIQSAIQNKYPNIVLAMPTAGLQANAWNKLVIEVANKGTLAAQDVHLAIEGDVEVRAGPPLEELGVDETKAVEIGVKPTKPGEVPVNVRVFYRRYFDDNRYEESDETTLKVESPGTYLVEDVFLIHLDGRLIAHESRQFRQEIDEDIFSGMLTVVQDFIRDSFRQRTETGLKRLDFGQSKILIERSQHCYLTAVVLGSEPALLPLYMAEVLREIERTHGNVLGNWTGMLHELPGVDETIRKLVLVTMSGSAEKGALANSEVAKLQRAIEAAKGAGAQTETVEKILAQAQSTLETDMELAFELLSKAKLEVKETQSKFHDRTRLMVDQTAEVVERLRVLGIDAGPSEILLKQAREAFHAGRYDKVEEIADNVRSTLERVQEDTVAKKVEADLNDLIAAIEDARKDGVDVTQAEAFLVKIEDALQRKNPRAVEENLKQAHAALEDARTKTLLKRGKEGIEKVTAMLMEAKEFGAEAAEAEALLLRAREALEENRAEDVDALARQAGTVARQLVQEFLEDKYPRLFVSMATTGMEAEAWNKLVLDVANKGTLAAKNVLVRLTGDIDVQGLQPIPTIDPNSKWRLEVGVKPHEAGPMPIDVEIKYQRPLDNKEYDLADSKQVRVEPPGTYTVEDAFLIHVDGRLIVSESRRFRGEVDEDIWSGMLTAVLEYVDKSMGGRTDEGLRRVDFGESKILFERGPHAYLAATVRGGEPVLLPVYMVEILRDVEERFGRRLEKWTGFLTEVEGIGELIRRILFVTEVREADLGPLASTPMAEAMRLVSQAGPEEAQGFIQEARSVIEAKSFEEASAFIQKTIESYTIGREELSAQLRDAVIAHGEATGIMVTDDQMREYIDIVKEMVEAAFAAREKAGIDRLWPVKRVALKLNDQTGYDAATSFRKIVVNQVKAKELDLVTPGETWRGLTLTLQLDSEAIFKAYRLWARKIEILLRSQDAWKVKAGIDRGEYFVGVEGQKLRIDPNMVWFEETVPEHIAVETFPHGTVYLDTQMDEEILAEGYARELVGIIRDVRTELKLPPEVWIETKIQASETLTRLLKKWKDFVTAETNSQAIKFVRGGLSDGYVVDCSLGQENFTVSVKAADTGAVSPGPPSL